MNNEWAAEERKEKEWKERQDQIEKVVDSNLDTAFDQRGDHTLQREGLSLLHSVLWAYAQNTRDTLNETGFSEEESWEGYCWYFRKLDRDHGIVL